MVNPPEHIDVLVVGGGVAGIAAARAAAMQGARTVLIDASDRRGGKATAAWVGTLCGIWLRHPDARPRPAMGGFPWEFAERLARASGTMPIAGSNGLKFLPYAPEAFALLCAHVLVEAKVEVRAPASVLNVDMAEQGAEVRWQEEGGVRSGWARAVVDCTGSAVVSAMAGDRVRVEDTYQAPAQVLELRGFDGDDAAPLNWVIQRALLRADARGQGIGPVSIIPGSLRDGRLLLKVGLPDRLRGDDDRAAIQAEGRALAMKVVDLLRSGSRAFAGAAIEALAPETGIRTDRRGVGLAILEEQDVLTCRKHPDGIANGAWPIEEWGEGRDARMTWFAEGEHYHIPAGTLRSARFPGLFFAGRGFSATERAIASARVMGTCLATGHAAGVLAACQAQGASLANAVAAIQKEQVYI